MLMLKKNWIFEDTVDFEYKQYILLAYLERVKAAFGKNELYPHLSHLIEQYLELNQLVEKKSAIDDLFPKELKSIDLEKNELIYEGKVSKTELIEEVERIIHYALPLLKQKVDEGKDLYDLIEENMDLQHVGLEPISKDEGYLFLTHYPFKETYLYAYQTTLFEKPEAKYRGLHIRFLEKVRNKLFMSFESIKHTLIKKQQILFNPAAFLIECKLSLPLETTSLPIAKRLLMRNLAMD